MTGSQALKKKSIPRIKIFQKEGSANKFPFIIGGLQWRIGINDSDLDLKFRFFIIGTIHSLNFSCLVLTKCIFDLFVIVPHIRILQSNFSRL